MYICKKAKNSDIDKLKLLNEEKGVFNKLNEDFFNLYNKINLIEKLLLLKKVVLLQEGSEYIGYIWTYKLGKFTYNVRAMNILGGRKNDMNAYKTLLRELGTKKTLLYICEKNQFNYDVLSNLGFQIKSGTLEMYKNLENYIDKEYPEGVHFEQFKSQNDELLRCSIQNAIFNNKDRMPLTIDDIYFEESEDYFFENGCIFIAKDNEYIGYGQIIFKDNNWDDVPYIVNFGVVPKYRGNGYGKYLLIYLLNFLYNNGHRIVKIKVTSDNYVAQDLYKKLGFVVSNEVCRWKLQQ